MLKMNIITPIEVQTDWENSMIAIEKPNGNLRICIDPRNLNQAITQPYYAIPTTRNSTKNERSKMLHQTRCQ